MTRQRPNGSWYGSWGVCFTYGAFFAIDAMVRAGVPRISKPIRKGCDFLVEKQNEDGGWGESYLSSVTYEWVSHDQSQIVNTAWALIALMLSEYENREVVDRGIKFLLQRQDANGDWPQESISGVFNGNCMITYTAYRNVFPLRALGLYREYRHTSK
jgi:lanosterol synthase